MDEIYAKVAVYGSVRSGDLIHFLPVGLGITDPLGVAVADTNRVDDQPHGVAKSDGNPGDTISVRVFGHVDDAWLLSLNGETECSVGRRLHFCSVDGRTGVCPVGGFSTGQFFGSVVGLSLSPATTEETLPKLIQVMWLSPRYDQINGPGLAETKREG